MLLRAWAYIRTLGRDGLERASELAVLNANYVLSRLSPAFDPIYGRRCMHEFVISASRYKRDHGVRALDIAKRLMDYGYHPPTIYFPLLIDEALMIEPTETESRETLDGFVEAMLQIVGEAEREPAKLLGAPYTAPVRRLDEARAVRQQVLRGPRGATAAASADEKPPEVKDQAVRQHSRRFVASEAMAPAVPV